MDWLNLFFWVFMGLTVAGFCAVMGTMAIAAPLHPHIASYMFGGLCYFCGIGALIGSIFTGLDQ